jgi:hypothetical protein
MDSVTVISWAVVVAGVLLSFKIARITHPAFKPVAPILVAPALGVGLALAGGAIHATCEELLKLCSSVTATNTYSLIYPLLATPLFLVVLLAVPHSTIREGRDDEV